MRCEFCEFASERSHVELSPHELHHDLHTQVSRVILPLGNVDVGGGFGGGFGAADA